MFTSAGLLGGGEVEAIDRFGGGADHGRLREGPGEEARRRPHVVPQELGRGEGAQQTGDAQDDGHRELGQRVLLQAPKELGPHLVAGGEQEQVEEDVLDGDGDLDVELADEDTGQQGADHGPQAERPEAEPADEEAHGQGQEDGQFRVLLEGLDEGGHGGPRYFFGARFEASKASR